jgi:hypothetical protein
LMVMMQLTMNSRIQCSGTVRNWSDQRRVRRNPWIQSSRAIEAMSE